MEALVENENELENLFAKLISNLGDAMPTFKIYGHQVVAAYRRPAGTAQQILYALRRSVKTDGLDPLRRDVVKKFPWDMKVKEVELWPNPEYGYVMHIDFVGKVGSEFESAGIIIIPPERAGASALEVLVPRAFYTVYVSGDGVVEKYAKLYKNIATFICNVKNCLVKVLDTTGRKYAEQRYRFCNDLKDGGQPGAT